MIVLAAFVVWIVAYFYEKRLEVLATLPVYHELEVASEEAESIFRSHGLVVLSGQRGDELMRSGSPILIDPKIRASFQSGNIQLYNIEQGSLYQFALDGHSWYVLNPDPPNAYIEFIAIGFVLLLLILFVLYRFVIGSVTPLKQLTCQIKNYQESGKIEGEKIWQKDEVGQVAAAFYVAAEKIAKLLHSRTLFMRNTLHELNTPIAQGKLLTATTWLPVEKRAILEQIFSRQERLIQEFAQMETAMSDKLQPDPKEWYLIDLVEGVLEDLLREEGSLIDNCITDERLFVDGRLLELVLKNLLGNALKYAEADTVITVKRQDSLLCVCNFAPPLCAPIEHYLQPFVQEKKEKGFGLGLYIVQEILERMNSHLSHQYEKNEHCFCVDLTPFLIKN